MIEIRLSTLDRLDEALALRAGAIGLGQEGCLTKLPTTDALRAAAEQVRAAGREVVVVAPIAWPRTADDLHDRLRAVAGDGPTTIAANDLGTALTFAGTDCTVVAGLGLTRATPSSADPKDGTPPPSELDTSLLSILGAQGVSAVETDTDTAIPDTTWQIRQLVDAVPVAYGRSCPTARHHRTGPPDCQSLCDTSFRLTPNARWSLNHGHREPLPAGMSSRTLTVWGNAVYRDTTAAPTAGYRILDARWHTAESLAAAVDTHLEHKWSTSH
jgi:hypothetical protein